MKTGIIKFNARDRGRKHRGQDRNFDTAVLCSIINSPEVQERVKNRDLEGFLGHWPRVMFGINPGEGGPDPRTGKHVRLEASHVTTMLRCDDAGNIEHEAEFLDTPPGRSAQRLFTSRRGGFSSAIACDSIGSAAGKDVAVGFYGFDYVSEPNFATNRGFALDSIKAAAEFEGEGRMVLMDSVAEDNQNTLTLLDGLYNDLQGQYDRMLSVVNEQEAQIQRQNSQIAELAGMLAKRESGAIARLDAAFERTPKRQGRGLLDMAAEFDSLPLVRREADAKEPEKPEARALSGIVSGFFGSR